MKKWLMYYLIGYLIAGGLGFALMPEFTLQMMRSNVVYDEPMVRLAGMLMTMLGALIGYLVIVLKDFRAYGFAIVARTVLVVFIFWMWTKFQNPMFVVLEIIILIGLVPSYINMFIKRKPV